MWWSTPWLLQPINRDPKVSLAKLNAQIVEVADGLVTETLLQEGRNLTKNYHFKEEINKEQYEKDKW